MEKCYHAQQVGSPAWRSQAQLGLQVSSTFGATPPMRRWLAVLDSVVLFISGTLIYLLLLPQRTIEEEYLVTLEEEALLRAIEGSEGKK